MLCLAAWNSPRARVRSTPAGRFELICVRSKVYAPPAGGVLAGTEEALLDFVYLCRRRGVDAAAQVTFRHLERIRAARVRAILKRYPATVALDAGRLLSSAACAL